MKITIQTSDHSLSSDLKAANIDGITIYIAPKLAMDSIEISDLSTIIITIASAVTIIDWLCDRLKKKPNEKTVINGNQINSKTANVTQITQIVLGESKNKKVR
jgi:hypothetical protein